MDSHNPDLISDLAAGILPEAEARAAEASLTEQGRAELAAQRAVLAAIADAPPVAMTDIERAHLHRSVAAAIADTTRELSPVSVAAPPPAARKTRSTTWLRWASAAAVAAMFVGVVAVGSQLTGIIGSSNDDTADTIAATAADLTSTTAAAAAGGAEMLAGSERFGLESADGADAAMDEATLLLPVAPPLAQAGDKSALAPLAGWLIETERQSLEPIEDLRELPCYEVAVEDDDLDIVDGFTVLYPGPGGEPRDGIGYADGGTDTVDRIIRIYDRQTCEPVLATTD